MQNKMDASTFALLILRSVHSDIGVEIRLKRREKSKGNVIVCSYTENVTLSCKCVSIVVLCRLILVKTVVVLDSCRENKYDDTVNKNLGFCLLDQSYIILQIDC